MFYKENLKRIRREKKVSQDQLARLMGRSSKTIYRWETGERSPTDSEVRIMAQIFNVDIKDLGNIDEISLPHFEKNIKNTSQRSGSFVEKIESAISIQDRIFLNGINAELQTLRDQVRKLEKKTSPSETVVDKINSFIYKKDLNGRFTYINKSLEKYLDIADSAILGKNNMEIFGWREAEALDKLEAEAIKTPTINNRHIVIPGSMGKKHGLFSTSSIYKTNGMLDEIVVKIDDITDELEAVERYKTLEKVIHSSSEILWIKSTYGKYFFVGAPFYTISGYHTNEILNNPKIWLTNIVDEFDREKVGNFYATFKSGNSLDYKIKTKSGETKFVNEKVFRQDKLTFGIIQDLTDKLKAEEDKQLLLDIIDEMPEPIDVVKNYGKEFAVCSQSLLKMLGTSKTTLTEIYEEELTSTIHPDDREKVAEYRKYLSSDEWWKSETKKSMQAEIKYRLKQKNGKTKWLSITTYSTPKLKKKGVRFSIVRDITKEQQQQLEMQYLFECVNDMDSLFWAAKLIDKEKNLYKYITVSEGVKKIFGLTKAKYINNTKTLKTIVRPGTSFSADNDIAEITFPYSMEYPKQVNGKQKWLQERIYKKGNLLFGLTRDITKEKDAIQQQEEEKIKRLKAELQYNNIANFIDGFNDGIWYRDKDKYLFFNPAMVKIYGYSKEEMNKNPNLYLNSIVPEDRERVARIIEKKRLSKKRGVFLKYRIIDRQKIEKQVNVSISWIYTKDNHFSFGVMRETSNIK